MKVRVDEDLCTGCEDCVDIAGSLFEMGDDDLAHAKVEDVPPEEEDNAKKAADECPAAAIEVE